jgi:hypothetical protein
MLVRRMSAIALWLALMALVGFGAHPAAAQDEDIGHFGENRLEFEAVGDDAPADASGKGVVDYRGGEEPSSRWRASFRFSGLDEATTYTVVVRGRFGDAESDEADAFTSLCSFETDDEGRGSCFWYFRGLARLNVVQLRVGDEEGERVMQASRSGNQGSIETDPNRFSPGGEIAPRKAEGDTDAG